MTSSPESYGKALLQMGIGYETVLNCEKLLTDNPALFEALCNQMVKKDEKHRICDRLFDSVLSQFLKYLCDNECIDSIFEMIAEYEEYYLESENVAKATLRYVHMPEEYQLCAMKKMLCRQLGKKDILLVLKYDPSIVGGCVLSCGSLMYDRSVKGALEGMKRKLLWR